MIGPSGPTHSPEGIEHIIPTSFERPVCHEMKEVSWPPMCDLPPEGTTPLRKAISPGMPDEAEAGSSSTHLRSPGAHHRPQTRTPRRRWSASHADD
jgi:hypothetical protein